MRKQTLIPLLALFCGCTSAPEYRTMVQTTYNLNSYAVHRIMESDTTQADYITTEKKESLFIFDKQSQFIFKVSAVPRQIEIISPEGEASKWTAERGYMITQKKNADTLTVRFFPTARTPQSVYKFGIEYKFYK